MHIVVEGEKISIRSLVKRMLDNQYVINMERRRSLIKKTTHQNEAMARGEGRGERREGRERGEKGEREERGLD